MPGASVPRRRLLYGGALGLFAAGLLPDVARADDGWHNIDVTGSSAPLEISMSRAGDGKQVSAADYKGRVVLLYFGYTYCPDVCPLTLTNLGHVLDGLGPLAQRVRILFVTVDPNRDTLPVLKEYAASFGPQVEGLRGSQDALAALARRYRIAYSVTPSNDPRDHAVTHSSAIYVFGPTGAARLLIPSMASQSPDIDGTVADLRRLIQGEAPPGPFSHILTTLRQLG